MKAIAIRTLGGQRIGYGHYYRCYSLAKAIRVLDKDVDITFIINQELVNLIKDREFNFKVSNNLSEDYKIIDKLEISLFIFDSYLGNNEYLKKIKNKTKLMLIDDNNDIYDSSIPSIICNGNIHAENLGYYYNRDQLRLLGSKYLIMKEEYWGDKQDKDIYQEGILITTGGTDEYGITLKIMEAIKDLNIKVNIVIGPGYRNDYIQKIEDITNNNINLVYKPSSLKKYIRSSKIVITAGGSTIYEILSQGNVPIIFSMADNQDLICEELRNKGIEYLGKYPYIDYSKLIKVINRLQNNGTDLNGNTFNLINNNGALLVAKRLMS